MTAELYRRKVGEHRRYFDPLPPCPLNEAPDADADLVNVTGITGSWQGQFNKNVHGLYGPLDAHRAAAWAVANLDALQAHEPEEGHVAIVRAAKADLYAAMDRGTAVHEMIEDELTGQPRLLASDKGDAYRDTVLDLIAWLDPQAVIVEAAAFSPTEGYGGTFDAVITSQVLGGTFLIDWKTRGADSSHGCYPKEVAQLGLLAAAEYYIANGERHEMPRIDGCALVSIKPDGFEVYPVDLDGAIEAGERALETYKAKVSGEAEAKAATGKALTRTVSATKGGSIEQRRAAVLLALPTDPEVLQSTWAHRLSGTDGKPRVPGPKRFEEWADDETLDRIEDAFGLSFMGPRSDLPEPTPVPLDVAPAAPRPKSLDDNGVVDKLADDMLVKRYAQASRGVRAWREVWHKEGDAAGKPWRPVQGAFMPVRVHELLHAALWFAKVIEQQDNADDAQDDVRRALATVLGDVALMPTITIGACLGELTLAEAMFARTLGQAMWEGEVRLTDEGLFEVAA